MSSHRYYTKAEVASILRRTPGAVDKMRLAGAIPQPSIFGNRPLWASADFEAWLAARKGARRG